MNVFFRFIALMAILIISFGCATTSHTKSSEATEGGDVTAEEANANAKDKTKITALVHASLMGNLDVVRSLIEEGVDLNAVDDSGGTALEAALFSKHRDVFQLLV